MQVKVHLRNPIILGLLRCLARSDGYPFALALLQHIIRGDHTGLVVAQFQMGLRVLFHHPHQPTEGPLQFEPVIRSYHNVPRPTVPQDNAAANLVHEGNPVPYLQLCGSHAPNLRAQPSVMNATALLVALLLAPLGLFAQGSAPCVVVGGRPALDRLFEQELHYPDVALEAGIKGEVVVTAKLDQHGGLVALEVGRSLSPECDAEALRVVRMILWRPSLAGIDCAGKEHYLSVPFDPGRYKRWSKARHSYVGDVFSLPKDTTNTVYTTKQLETQVIPMIPNGMAGLPRFLAQELRYPPEAFRLSLDGTVQVEFVVEPSGSLSNMRVLQEVGGGCNEEAMRLMYRMPWQPGVRNGQRVRSTLQVSIRFDLPKERH